MFPTIVVPVPSSREIVDDLLARIKTLVLNNDDELFF